MTCRVARSYQRFVQMEPVPCSECGSTYLDVRVASGTPGPNLCPICARSLGPHVVSSVHAPRVLMRHQKVA
jgi:predicted Zn-ribbon and HTH transcriptional regulator